MRLRISKLCVEELLGIDELEIDEVGNVTYVRGPNEAGKTSIIEALKIGLGGTSDGTVIRKDGPEARVYIEIMDGKKPFATIDRTIKASGRNGLKVKNPEGFPITPAQGFIDDLLGSMAFNPVKFYELKSRQRKEYLLKALPVKLDRRRVTRWCGEVPADVDLREHGLEVLVNLQAHYHEQRRQTHVLCMDKEGGAEEIAKGMPEEFDVASARKLTVKNLSKIIAADESATTARRAAEASVSESKQDVSRKEGEIKQVELRLKKLKKDLEDDRSRLDHANDQLAKVKGPPEDEVREARRKLKEYDEIKERLARHDEMTRLQGEAATLREKHEKLDALVDFLKNDAALELLEKLPPVLKGLTIEQDELRMKGVPLDKRCSAEQLTLAVGIARALAGDLPLICVDGLERLDPEARKKFLAECGRDKFQYFVTEVTAGKAMRVTSGA